MTEFKKLSENVQEWQQTLDTFDQSPLLNLIPSTLSSASSSVPTLPEVETFLTTFRSLRTLVTNEIIPRVTKFKQRAVEPDPDKRMYGPAMCTKILELAAQVDTLLPRYERLEQGMTEWETWTTKEYERQHHQRMEDEKQKKLRMEEEKQRLEDEENARLAALKAEKEQAKQQLKLAAEKLQQEQEQRHKQQEELKKKEDEIRKRTLAEADAKAKADAEERERRERDDRRRRAEEAVQTAKRASGIPSFSSSSSSVSSSSSQTYYRTGLVNEVTSPAHFQNILQSAKDTVILVDWFAHWCGPCKRIAPLLDQLATQQTDILFCKIDGDAQPMLTATANIRAFPTFHIYFRNQLQESFSGANIDLIKMNLAKVSAKAEEILLAEAVTASMQEDDGGKKEKNTDSSLLSSASSSSSSSSSLSSSKSNTMNDALDTDENDDQRLLGSILRLNMVPDKNQGTKHNLVVTSTPSSTSSSTSSTMTSSSAPVSPSSSSSASDSSASSSSSIRTTIHTVLQDLRKNISKAEYTAALQALLKYVENLLAHPTEIMYRSIKKSNPAFRARISRHTPYGERLMTLLGFSDTMKGEGTTAEMHMVYSPLNSSTNDSAASDIRLLIAKELFTKDLKELNADTLSPSTGSTSTTTATTLPTVNPPAFPGMNSNNLFGGLGGLGGSNNTNPFGGLGGMTGMGGMDMNNLMSMMNDPMVQAAMNNPAILQQAMNMASSMGLGGDSMGGLASRLNAPSPATSSTPAHNTNSTSTGPPFSTVDEEEAALQEAIRLSMLEEEEKKKKRQNEDGKKE